MKILVFSDSHRDITLMSRVLDKTGKEIEMVFHLGDCIDDVIQLGARFPDKSFTSVRGNCDYNSTDGEQESIITIRDRKIFLTHGHRYDVKFSLQRIAYAAEERQVDACLFGHTHQPALFENGSILFMNPGSIAQPRGVQNPSYAILDISTYGVINGQIIEAHGNVFRPVI